jgi:hypothetical protein
MALHLFRGQVADIALEGGRGDELAPDAVDSRTDEASQEEIGLSAIVR